MKNPDRKKVSLLTDLPNIGKSTAKDLRLIGIDHPRKLIGKNPFDLYDELCMVTGQKQDPCIIDVFISAVNFMEGGDPLPWWSFTDERKKHINQNKN
ncbi:helix-hairpin-helix domain-containing protein [bacterium]|nr:helix-hairpin-helix domain-containing protein [bacterium]